MSQQPDGPVFVYDDDGISTKAEVHGEYFRMATETSFDSTVKLTLRVEHAKWQPDWQRVHWEIGGSSVGQWESVRCGGFELPRIEAVEDLGTAVGAGARWARNEYERAALGAAARARV